MSQEQKNIEIVGGILEAVNYHNYEILDKIMAADFLDHHPGIGEGIKSRDAYRQALTYMHSTLDMKAALDFSFAKGDKVVTRVTLTGKHIGAFLNIPPTKKDVKWTTIEIYRIENDQIKERWALDNFLGLFSQIGVKIPA